MWPSEDPDSMNKQEKTNTDLGLCPVSSLWHRFVSTCSEGSGPGVIPSAPQRAHTPSLPHLVDDDDTLFHDYLFVSCICRVTNVHSAWQNNVMGLMAQGLRCERGSAARWTVTCHWPPTCWLCCYSCMQWSYMLRACGPVSIHTLVCFLTSDSFVFRLCLIWRAVKIHQFNRSHWHALWLLIRHERCDEMSLTASSIYSRQINRSFTSASLTTLISC